MSRVFDASTSNYLSVATSKSGEQDWSLACYVNPDVTNISQAGVSIANSGQATQPRMLAGLHSGGGAWGVAQIDNYVETNGGTATQSAWQLVVVTYDVSTDDITLYLDSATAVNSATGSGTASTTINQIAIGILGDSTPSGAFDGKVAQAAVWEGLVLSGTDVQALLDARSTAEFGAVQSASLLCHYPLFGSDLSDYTGTLSDLTVNGTVATSTDNPIGHGAVYVNDAATKDGGEVLQTYPGEANWSDTTITMGTVIDTTGLTPPLYVLVETATGAVASRAITVSTGGSGGSGRGILRGLGRGIG